ncbi:dna repair protein rad51 [Diaporthe amygdali]|uniref:dna repair protein rad51 n=1 Tax=Phomopsis amygdali TaxID=1214568 RepID=UPI0022FE1E24|nr:dna repair protein rad51 [Diaporthe amygdali]KAJ0114340.1 dna repair protein rad51 [Diaporthe amygdali]
MEPEPPILFKETRVNLEPASNASIVHIRLPAPTRSRDRRSIGLDKYGEEERTYRSRNLASAASIYHRKHHDSPRSFLWRVLEDDTVLSIRAADVSKQQNAPDANLILNLRFPNPIRASCIALADAAEHDALSIFALDHSNYLYTIVLRPDHFRKRSATENGIGDACKTHLSGAFSFKHPHRLVAVSAHQVVVTFHDGGLIRFDRDRTHNANSQTWKETNFSAQGWATSFRSLLPLPFQGGHTIKHGKANMELSAATSVVTDTLGVESAKFLFSVCLDHRLRIWNVQSGAILYTADMLGVERNPQEIGKWIIDPGRDNLVRIVGQTEGRRTLVTYSPVANEFKFWKVETQDDTTIFVHDMFPDQQLTPPGLSSGDVWTLADFGVAQPTGQAFHLWVLTKNNLTYRVQKLEFRASDSEDDWRSGWMSVHIDNEHPSAESSNPGDPTDATEKWLQTLFYPGRFSRATLEAALAMYERGLGSKETTARNGKGLIEAVCSVLGSTATLDRLATGEMDFDQFRSHSQVSWRRFYRLVLELDKQRGEALSLALDHNSGLAWVLCADVVAAVHPCSTLDQIYHKSPGTIDVENENVAALVSAGLDLVDNFSDSIMQQANAALRLELFDESSDTDMERIQRFFDESASWRGISEEDAAQVVESLGSDFRIVTQELYRQLVDLFATTEDARARDVRHPLTEFGRKVVVKSVQETAELQWQVLLSQLLLLVHMEYEYDEDNEESALHSRLDIGFVYRQLIEALKHLEFLRWLVKTEISVPVLKPERSNGSPTTTKRPDDMRTITAFEVIISHLLGLVDVDGEPLASSLTDVVIDICAPDSGIELSPALIQCSLLKADRPDLALELKRFCDQDPFPVYIQGRVFLFLKDYTTAALHFKKAAVGMSVPMKHTERHTGGLLDETEKNLLNSGLANYYSHIVSLFDRHKAFSYVIDFARLSLQFAQAPDSKSTRIEMLSRLFTASTSISRFDMAHATLLSMPDRALKLSCLKKLVERMCETAQTSELTALPFSGMQEDVDSILQQKCRATTDVVRGTPYHQILYAWRITHNDYRGAAAVLHDRLQKLRQTGEADRLNGDDVLDTAVTRQFLLLINALSCVDPKQAWITVEEAPAANGDARADHDGAAAKPRRKVVTLADLRRQYQAELDRIAAIQNNQFGFTAEDDDDVMVIDP